MQKIIIIISVLAMLLLREECHAQSGSNRYTAGINYTVGVPTFVPNGNVSKVAIDTGTMKWYEYAQVGGWRWSGDRVQDISGCAAPAYTPGKAQSRLVLNSCTVAQNGHGPEMYKYTGSAWLCLNCGGNYTAGDGIGITGAVITNTGDLSNTNELQTLSIDGSDITLSNGGGTVTVPGGGVTFPLLAPYSEDTPVYSFSDKNDAGIYRNGSGITITEGIEFGGDAKGIYINGGGGTYSGGPVVLSGGSSNGPGGSIGINAGNSFSANGGSFGINAGSSTNGNGGDMTAIAGSSDNYSGGGFSFYAGNGAVSGGSYSMNSGTGVTGDGGFFALTAGSSNTGNGGSVSMESGGSTDGNGGDINIMTGGSENAAAGAVNITTGNAAAGGGRIVFSTGYDSSFNQQIVEFYVSGILLSPITEAQRDAIVGITAGLRVYCIDCAANDSSTGVEQTYNGSTWKNHW